MGDLKEEEIGKVVRGLVDIFKGEENEKAAEIQDGLISDFKKNHDISYLDSLDLMYKTIRNEISRNLSLPTQE